MLLCLRLRICSMNVSQSMPQTPGIVSSWADTGHVHIWDLRSTFTAMQAGAPRSAPTRPYFTFDGHRDEGFAMDWSRADVGKCVFFSASGLLVRRDPSCSFHLVVCCAEQVRDWGQLWKDFCLDRRRRHER
jgi:hypothetical protein